MMRTFGIEEEFMLVDRRTLAPVDLAGDAVAELGERPHRGEVTNEFLPSQLEHATAICEDLEEARLAISSFRSELGAWAKQHGLRAIGSGTPFDLPGGPPEFSSARYRRIARDVGMLAGEHLINGMHVHVGVSGLEEGVRVVNGLRPWLPLLVGLSSNSPFWAGADTGHHSWRSIQVRRWTTHGTPPHFHDYEEYQSLVARLQGVGATSSYSSNGWAVRLSPRFPTVEIRVCDAQLGSDSTLGLASVLRALAHACAQDDRPPHHVRTHVLDSEWWHAARWGITQRIYDPTSDSQQDAAEAIASLRGVIAPAAQEQRADDCVAEFFERIAIEGTGATRQRDALRDGVEGLSRLHARAFSAAAV